MVFKFNKDKGDEQRNIHLSSSKPVMRDIVSKKSSLPAKPARTTESFQSDRSPQKITEEPPRLPPKKEKKKLKMPKLSINYPKGFEKVKAPKIPSFSRIKIIFIGALIFILAIFIVNWLSYVQINIVPRQETKEVNVSFNASAKGGVDLIVATVTFTQNLDQEQKTTGLKEIRDEAHGEIVIYNSYSSQPQILVRNTRFETPDGKIYRISENITVPGANVVEGEIKPSSIVVEIFADEPGEDYNIGLTDFTIPGFKGSVKYEKFYARSKTPMTGGFIGVAPVVLREDVDVLKNDTKSKLEKMIVDKIKNEIPEELFIPSGASRIQIDEEKLTPAIGEKAQILHISLKGSFEGMLIKKKDLENAIISVYYGAQMADKIGIANFDKLKIEAKNVDFEESDLSISVQGDAHFVWLFDQDRMAEDLIFASRKNRLAVFENFPAVERADIDFMPYWWPFFPNKAEKLDINILLIAS